MQQIRCAEHGLPTTKFEFEFKPFASVVLLQQIAINNMSIQSKPYLPCVLVFRIQVRERDLPMVMHTLSSEFTLLRVVNGETVAANCSGVTNGFVKPKLGEKFFICAEMKVVMFVVPTTQSWLSD